MLAERKEFHPICGIKPGEETPIIVGLSPRAGLTPIGFLQPASAPLKPPQYKERDSSNARNQHYVQDF